MNDTDTRILQHLMEDGRKSIVEIAKAIGVVEETVRRRMAGLQRDGIYEVVAVPNYRKLGYGVELLLGIEADGSQLDDVRSMNDVTTVLNENIRNISGIDRMVTFYCIETMKQWTATGAWYRDTLVLIKMLGGHSIPENELDSRLKVRAFLWDTRRWIA